MYFRKKAYTLKYFYFTVASARLVALGNDDERECNNSDAPTDETADRSLAVDAQRSFLFVKKEIYMYY